MACRGLHLGSLREAGFDLLITRSGCGGSAGGGDALPMMAGSGTSVQAAAGSGMAHIPGGTYAMCCDRFYPKEAPVRYVAVDGSRARKRRRRDYAPDATDPTMWRVHRSPERVPDDRWSGVPQCPERSASWITQFG